MPSDGTSSIAPQIYSLAGKRVFLAGHRGLVGAALARRLQREGCAELQTVTRGEVDLADQAAVRAWMTERRPHAVFLAAAKVGGIAANAAAPASFLYQNLMIASNVIEAAHRVGVEKLLFLGSSCIYPRLAEQPISEDALLTGPLEPTNEWYAIAKIAGVKLCQAYRRECGDDFISAMPTNLYGPGDNFDLETSHVFAALLRKAHEARSTGAKSMTVWGSGEPRREFLHVDDCADALVFLMTRYSGEQHVNVGCGHDIRIADLARLAARVAGFEGEINFDRSRPEGTLRKLLATDVLARMGWRPRISLERGMRETMAWYEEIGKRRVVSGQREDLPSRWRRTQAP